MPLSRSTSACARSAPAKTTTPVVPSPISLSCDLESSTRSRAISCSTCIFSRIVAPSFVTVTSPSPSTMILSMPFGPSDDRRVCATVRAARMCCLCASSPRMRDFFSCSRRMMIGRPFSSKAKLMLSS
eukprot:Amastigsp_a676308_541.p3 type:complete len:128 gc:universal Amastigsp_a676308_541:1261-1644(+)